MSIFDASEKYAAEKVPLVVLAGKEYGSGSSRDWAAKGPLLLGVRAVIAESYERIHRSNLVGMGILPLQFLPGENAASLGLTGEEVYATVGLPRAAGRRVRRRARAGHPRERADGTASTSRRWCASTRRRRSPTTSTAASCRSCCGSSRRSLNSDPLSSRRSLNSDPLSSRRSLIRSPLPSAGEG